MPATFGFAASNRRTRSFARMALRLFYRAVELDPEFATA
jgi:hypothetical protein